MPLLSHLAESCPEKLTYDGRAAALSVTGITADSRQVKPGYLFVAVPGTQSDGAQFIPDAVRNGAAAIIAQAGVNPVETGDAAWIESKNPRRALALIAAALYAPQPAHVVAITGTDGKTSTADFFRQLSAMLGHRAASIGTLGTLGENRKELAPGVNTTPDPAVLHRTLQSLAQDGYTHVGMEASSHGLDQFRLDGVRVEAAAFTNLTRDHLDYHGTDEAYFTAKARLFSELLPAGCPAVLNTDDARFETLKAIVSKRGGRLLTYGRNGADFRIIRQTPTPLGQAAELQLQGKTYHLDLPHVGGFQVYNMLAAMGLLCGMGEDAAHIAELLPKLSGVPGRLERVDLHPSGAAIFIDYAHTPAALANVLATLRPHTPGRLVVVFGCGGDRDRGKRPQMGKAATERADIVLVTDDNPRSEVPAAIRQEIMAAAPGAKEVADREQAIYRGVQMLEAGDVLLVAGKGHEKTQIIGNKTIPFDDAEVIREAVKKQ